MSRRQQAQEAALAVAAPILADLGLELLEVLLTGPARAPVLRFTVDRPGGGVTVDDLQQCSQAIETALEVAEVLPGRYNLEVSSPGLDRPLKRPEDFVRHLGERVDLKTFAPLPDGRRLLSGRLAAVADGVAQIETEERTPVAVALSNIASAKPHLDWAALLRGRKPAPAARKGERHEP